MIYWLGGLFVTRVRQLDLKARHLVIIRFAHAKMFDRSVCRSKVFDLIVFVHKEREISLLLIITAAVVRVFAE